MSKGDRRKSHMLLNFLVVGIGGFTGAGLRYLIGEMPVFAFAAFPLSTFLINVTGAFAVGLIAEFAAYSSGISPLVVLFLKTGLCGGFTTFSAFSLESANMLLDGRTSVCLFYTFSSVILGVCAIFASRYVFRLFFV